MPNLPLIKQSMAAVGASAARTLKQMMKPHVPMIKFPKRGEPVKGSQMGNLIGNPSSQESLLTNSLGAGKMSSGSTSASKTRGSSIDSSELPFRFKRKPLSAEEMEFIEKGGKV